MFDTLLGEPVDRRPGPPGLAGQRHEAIEVGIEPQVPGGASGQPAAVMLSSTQNTSKTGDIPTPQAAA